jgi:Ca2+-transporting ATPase
MENETLCPGVVTGLTQAEVAQRRERFGPNVLVPESDEASLLAWVVRLVADPMVILLGVAGVTYLALGDHFDAAVSLGALLPIFLVNAVLEKRSEDALRKLRELAAPTVVVRRGGREITILAVDLVPDDLLVVREGDVMAADGHLVEGERLTYDESSLTGESVPVRKSARDELDDRIVLAGTTLLSGYGTVRVTAIGAQTQYGQIGALMSQIRGVRTPMERILHRIVRKLGAVVLFLCVAITLVQHYDGQSWPLAIIAGVSLAMAAFPEELPMVYTLYLALGAWRLAKDNALVRRLASVETLGSVDTICTDKTGTLTTGKLAVADAVAAANISSDRLCRAAAMASDPRTADPLDLATRAYAASRDCLPGGLRMEKAFPFETAEKYATNVWSDGATHRVAAKGAFEVLASKFPASDQEMVYLSEQHQRLAMEGKRVLAVADGELPVVADGRSDIEAVLRVIGLVAFSDPVRQGVPQAVAECLGAGVDVKIVTGDQPLTARSIARDVGLDPADDRILTGPEIEVLSDLELAQRIGRTVVFARTRPEQKLRIIRALHACGRSVAMTGDGTNDALALREADIGVAMGQRGTEVARSAAGMILLDDNFTTIGKAVRDGRRIFANLGRAFRYLTAFHIPLVLSALTIPLFRAPLLLLPVHLVWLELIVHPTSGLIFENEPLDPEALRRPPVSVARGLFRRRDIAASTAIGLSLAIVTIALYLWQLRTETVEAARSMALSAMIVGQIAIVLIERSEGRPFWNVSIVENPRTLPILAFTIASLLLGLYLPPLAHVLELSSLSPSQLSIAVAVGLLATLWFEPMKLLLRNHSRDRARFTVCKPAASTQRTV